MPFEAVPVTMVCDHVLSCWPAALIIADVCAPFRINAAMITAMKKNDTASFIYLIFLSNRISCRRVYEPTAFVCAGEARGLLKVKPFFW